MTNLESVVRNLLARYPDILYGFADANRVLFQGRTSSVNEKKQRKGDLNDPKG